MAAAARTSGIVTLTVNPALDLSPSTDRLVPEHKLRCGPSVVEAGGGGVNVSRIIARLGGASTALVTVGGATGGAYRELLAADSAALAGDGAMATELIPIAGATRQNITIDEAASGAQYHFVLQGPTFSDDEGMLCLDTLASALDPGTAFVVLSGSLPPGAPDDLYVHVVQRAREHGVRAVVDASGAALAAVVEAGPHLIKPSGRELRELAAAARAGVAAGAATASMLGTQLGERAHIERLEAALAGDAA